MFNYGILQYDIEIAKKNDDITVARGMIGGSIVICEWSDG